MVNTGTAMCYSVHKEYKGQAKWKSFSSALCYSVNVGIAQSPGLSKYILYNIRRYVV